MDGSMEVCEVGSRQDEAEDGESSEADEPSPYESDTENVDLEEFVQSLSHDINEWKIYHMNDLDLQSIGNGFFGEIYKATERHSNEVVVMKMVKKITKMKLVCAEIRLMCRLKHPNILRFLGVCIHDAKVSLITKYMDVGNLEQLILDLSEPLPWTLRMKLAHDISEGMAYLHGEGVIHRDLGSKNVLISNEGANYVAVVGDFGLAAKIPSRKKRLNVVGSPYWMAPEVIRHDEYNETVDIFSYGIILCEIIGRVQSSPDDIPRTNKYGLDVDKFREQVEGCPPEFLQLAVCCCQLEPESRPPFELTAKFLEYIMQLSINDGSPTKLLSDKCTGNARLSANIEDWLMDKKKILDPSLNTVSPRCSEACVCDTKSNRVGNGTYETKETIEKQVPLSNEASCKRRRSNKRNSFFGGLRYKYFRPTVVTEDLVKSTPSKLAGFFNRVLHVQKRPKFDRPRKARSKSTGSEDALDKPRLRSYRLFDENKERKTSEVLHRHPVRVQFSEAEESVQKFSGLASPDDMPGSTSPTSPSGTDLHHEPIGISYTSLEQTTNPPSRSNSSYSCSAAEGLQTCTSPNVYDHLDFSCNSSPTEREESLLKSWPQASLREVTNLSKSLQMNGCDELEPAAIPRCKSESNVNTKPLSMKFRSLSTCPQPQSTKTRKYRSFMNLFRKQGKEKPKR